jgi:pimeloyl-ACP methyl ester carboxylesterase
MTASLLLLPGLACDEELFAGQLPALRERHRVHISDVHTRAATLPAMAELLWAEAPPGLQVLVGFSMGGMLALEMHRQAPQRVQALALLSCTARADTPQRLALREQACGLFAAGRMDEVLAANVLVTFHPASAARRELVAAYLAMVRRAGPEQLIRQNRAVMARGDSRPLLPGIAVPTLVAVGEADTLVPAEHAHEMAEAVRGAELHRVPGAGHMLPMEQPAALAGLLADWLARRVAA